MPQLIQQDNNVITTLRNVGKGISRLSAENILMALLDMPPADRAHLAERLLCEPPVDSMRNLLPLILYFPNYEERSAAAEKISQVLGLRLEQKIERPN